MGRLTCDQNFAALLDFRCCCCCCCRSSATLLKRNFGSGPQVGSALHCCQTCQIPTICARHSACTTYAQTMPALYMVCTTEAPIMRAPHNVRTTNVLTVSACCYGFEAAKLWGQQTDLSIPAFARKSDVLDSLFAVTKETQMNLCTLSACSEINVVNIKSEHAHRFGLRGGNSGSGAGRCWRWSEE